MKGIILFLFTLIPTFSVISQNEFTFDMYSKKGLKTVFTDFVDFSGMRKEKDLKIGAALHKAKIIVDEEGTEADAVTR